MEEALPLKYSISEQSELTNTKWYDVTKYREAKYLSMFEQKCLNIWLPNILQMFQTGQASLNIYSLNIFA